MQAEEEKEVLLPCLHEKNLCVENYFAALRGKTFYGKKKSGTANLLVQENLLRKNKKIYFGKKHQLYLLENAPI